MTTRREVALGMLAAAFGATLTPGARAAESAKGTVNIYINDQAAFDAAGKEHTRTLVQDVPHFSSVMPTAFPTVIYGIG